jgi:DNA-3-methyladenine glycosylase
VSPSREQARLVRLLSQPAPAAARALLGCILVRRLGARTLEARIVEAEAYLGFTDPAAHVYRGRTPRTAPLFGPPGTLYVYFVYGMHHCLNIAVDAADTPGCVLIRAAEPLPGGGLAPDALRGPGRLCRALAIDTRLSGRHLFEPSAPLTLRPGPSPPRVSVSRRIGINVGQESLLRFCDAASAAVSGTRPAGISFLVGPPRAPRPRVRPTVKRGIR